MILLINNINKWLYLSFRNLSKKCLEVQTLSNLLFSQNEILLDLLHNTVYTTFGLKAALNSKNFIFNFVGFMSSVLLMQDMQYSFIHFLLYNYTLIQKAIKPIKKFKHLSC